MTEYPTHQGHDDVPHGISIIRDLRHTAFRSSEKAVLWALASRLNPKKGIYTIFSAMSTIASDAGLDESAARRIVNWFVSIGVVVEVDGPYRSKCRQINFDRLVSLPAQLKRVRGVHVPVAPADVQGNQDLGTPSTKTAPPAQDTPTQDLGPPGGVHVPAEGCPRPAKVRSKNKTRTHEEHTARVPRRSNGSGDGTLGLNFGQSDQPTSATNAEPLPAHPGALASTPVGPDAENVLGPSVAPQKASTKSKSKGVRKFTDEQIAARDVVYAFWKKTYFDEFGISPVVGNAEVGQMVNLLKKANWDSELVCSMITNAFADVFFREKIRTIGHITANPTKYQTAPASERRAHGGQVDPGAEFWDGQDEHLAEDFGL